MVFCSYPFLFFFLFCLLVLRLLEKHQRAQLYFLLVMSSYFYGYWDIRFLGLLWVTATVDFSVAILIEKFPQHKKLLIVASVLGNVGQLAFFKYFDFFQTSTAQLLGALGIPFDPWLLGIILPVGISFYTFQSLSYTIDVYRGDMKACRDLPLFVTFVCYFPQLVAGPIERAPHLLPQLARPVIVRQERVLSGCLMVIWGSFKKSFAADIAGLYLVDPVFPNPNGGLELWLATLAFGLQIYCDFSGYCDIARGASRAMGIELVENFNAPYFAASITDFWRRWHISLSTWLRDYLYIPLGGNRRGAVRTYFNLWVTMFICGLWHGANLTFVLWGMYHGGLLLLHRAWQGGNRKSAHEESSFVSGLKVLSTFILVTYSWMIFRVADVKDLAPYTRLMLDPRTWKVTPVSVAMAQTLAVLFIPLVLAHLYQVRDNRFKITFEQVLRPVPLGLAAGTLVLLILALGTYAENLPFIYFQF
jgi:alginate O-acetyltransferase complex protein AlgI